MKEIKIISLAARNVRRKFIRTLLLLLMVAVVAGMLFSATVVIIGMAGALETITYRLGADILVVPEKSESEAKMALLSGEPTSFYLGKGILEKIKQIEGVGKASPQLFIKPTPFSCCYNVDTFLVAFDPATDFTITPWLKINLREPLAGNGIITGNKIPLIAGDRIQFFGTSFTILGTMESTGMNFFDQSAFMTMDAAYEMAENSKTKSLKPIVIEKNRVSAVLVKVLDNYTPEMVAIKIEYDISDVKAIPSGEITSSAKRHLNALLKGILATGALLWVLALLMTGFAFYMIVNERQRELGLLRSMGAKRGHIFRLVITEAVTISFAGSIVGIAFGSLLLFMLKNLMINSFKLPFILPSPIILIELISGAVFFSVTTGILSSFLPALSASRMEPYEAIRKGE